MTTNNNTPIPGQQVIKKLWAHKRLFIKVWIITFVLSVIYIFPKPRIYSANTLLAPEMSNGEQTGSLSALASSFGFNLGAGATVDAIYPELYPELMSSKNFIVSLFDIQVKTLDGEVDTDLYTYLTKYQKKAFYSKPMLWAKQQMRNLFGSKPRNNGAEDGGVNPFFLSEQQFNVTESLKENIICNVDPLTNVISIKVNAQDPLVAACLADSVCQRLQTAIVEYRTSKSRVDVEHYARLVETYREEYFAAVKAYSDFCDSHRNISKQSTRSEHDKLEMEQSLAMTKYQTMVTQLEAAKSKMQEATPAFTTLQNASVPLRPSAPKRIFFCLAMLILATVVTTGKVLKDELYRTIVFFGSKKQE